MTQLLQPSSVPVSSALLEGLNPRQREAVLYRGPALLIVAGAGSGKTSVLTRRIASLLETREAWPSQILAITFTNKAAGEMRERVRHLVGHAADGMWISTFHSACVRILRREAEVFGYASGFTIYDSGDSRPLLKRIIKQHEADVMGFSVANVAAKISKLKNELVDAETFSRQVNLADPKEAMFLTMFREYSRTLQAANAFDFDDLIAQTVYLFRAFPHVAEPYRRRFRHILVDEYQDTNHAQYALIRELTKPAPAIEPASLTVVGDSDQSIYAFRGADIRNIIEFEQDYRDATVVLLEQNYRSTQTILDAANAVIANNFDRKPKNLFTAGGPGAKIVGFTGYSGHDEAQFVADEIEQLHREGTEYREIAVFYRTNAQTRALEEILIRSAVPYRILGGTKFYERAEIKDAMAYLIAVANPADALAVRRILNSPKRGIGSVTETQLANFAERNGMTFRAALRHAGEQGFGPKIAKAITGLSDLLDEATALTAPPEEGMAPVPVFDVLALLMNRSGYVDALRASKDPQDEARLENIEELLAVTKEFQRNNPDGLLIDFLTETALVAAADELDDTSGTVSLMTLHTAKGLEFKAVFLTGIEEDLLPHRMSANEPGGPAEERRLFYVGITRARERLYLSLAMTRNSYGETSVSAPSRFLAEVPAELIEWKQSPGMAGPGGGSRVAGSLAWGGSSSGAAGGGAAQQKPKTEWTNRVTGKVRDNGDLELAVGDRVKHDDFGEGRVQGITGTAAKRIAEVQFDSAGRKRLLVKVAPIVKL
ncbi:DNA helicase PcrA [Amnibacterium soli]|uniref:DNA 3'-5' helicase n=1 Tax=Amnibacterium soli TaxID=1282736 RepID=A0ABP8Z981_9MICO